MTTFLAIIFGTASAGVLGALVGDAGGARDPQRLWVGSAVCMGIAVIGTLTALFVRRTPAAAPDLRFEPSTLAFPPDTRRLLAHDWPLLAALLVSCMFWLVSGVAMQAVNSLGMVQLGIGEQWTSIMTAIIGLGIAVGAILAGRLSHGRADFRIVTWGAFGMIGCLVLLAVSLPTAEGSYRHFLGFRGSMPVLVLLGMSAGMFAIPVQVFIQTRPPDEQKGRMIAVMNVTNFIAILLSGVIYMAFDRIVSAFGLPRSVLFGLCALLIVPVAILYRPRADVALELVDGPLVAEHFRQILAELGEQLAIGCALFVFTERRRGAERGQPLPPEERIEHLTPQEVVQVDAGRWHHPD
jgi:acyl-[acyl-carrier-protein]-phospholipid O-acyltransferase/long-chain-fatty-acid--[acyl-carrier-protein] ligase